MFGITIPPGVDHVRIIALNGKKGKPPCLWEGVPSIEQHRIEDSIGSDKRVVQWLQRNGMIDNGVATLKLQIDLFSQGKRVESVQVAETTLLVGNTPGQAVKAGSMGRPMPGVPVVLVDPVTGELTDEGELCLDLGAHPLNLMTGYLDDPQRNTAVMAGGYYRARLPPRRDVRRLRTSWGSRRALSRGLIRPGRCSRAPRA